MIATLMGSPSDRDTSVLSRRHLGAGAGALGDRVEQRARCECVAGHHEAKHVPRRGQWVTEIDDGAAIPGHDHEAHALAPLVALGVDVAQRDAVCIARHAAHVRCHGHAGEREAAEHERLLRRIDLGADDRMGGGDLDEALLTTLYTASGNPVLVNMIRTLWQHCRAYKIVGAQGTLDAESADSLWRYQKDLVAAARKQDGAAALSVSDASLDNATQHIRALLAAQKDEESASASDGPDTNDGDPLWTADGACDIHRA